ncbi:fimbria/pilus outer membrane usher protein [Palleronia sp. LCG004]|uniref:fimbria/pilus outer membrane usher protein n=1 Tax=Palleronia sp. LCG004 TaxID=3079304 RepID=UPI0029420631|nr:fimbria/pilus outer membrane usher protein [Palleronia sp. LCG004]WOI58435.1 fimbria/pilus outer membrane usher protein [Palleronia sp. LCG004]
MMSFRHTQNVERRRGSRIPGPLSLLAALFLGLAGPGRVSAQQIDPATAATADYSLYLEIVVNGRNTGLVLEVLRGPDGRFAMTRDALEQVGIDVTGLSGQELLLDAIPGISWSYVEATQRLEILAAQARLLPALLSPSIAERLDAEWSTGAAINYDLNLRLDGETGRALGNRSSTMGIDAWIFSGPARLSTTGLLRFGLKEGDTTRFDRYDTALDIDFPRTALSARIGDTISSVLAWGRPVRMAGLQIRRDFGLRRDLVTRPLLSYEGSAAVPSTIDVLIDDAPVFSTVAEPGRFRLDEVPVVSGPGTAIVSIQNADGTVTREALPFFGARDLLRQGIVDWSIEIGRPRLGFGLSEGSRYLPRTILSGTARYGLTDRVTLEGHAASSRDFLLAGGGLSTILGGRAEMTLNAGASRFEEQGGHFGYVEFSAYPVGDLRLEGALFRSSDGFTDLPATIDASDDAVPSRPPRRRDILSLSLPVGRHDFGLSYIRSVDERVEARRYGFNYSTPLPGGRGSLNLSASHDAVQDETRLAVLASLSIGGGTFQAAASDEGETALLYNRARKNRAGSLGYALEAVPTGPSRRIAGRIRTRTGIGEVELSGRAGARFSSLEARLRGAFATVDRRIAVGQPIDRAFAIVEGGRSGLPIRLQNREVAVTGPAGRALVTGLEPQASNRISIDIRDLPSDSVWQNSAVEVVPGRRTGHFVSFGIDSWDARNLVTLIDASGSPLPLGTAFSVAGRRADLGVGYDGAALLSGADIGAEILAMPPSGTCRAIVPQPAPDGRAAEAICR